MGASLGLIIRPWGCDVAEVLAGAEAADEYGLEIWLPGQIQPTSSSNRKAAFEPLTLAAAVAARTAVSRLGFMVLGAPYVTPVYLAKALATLDHISGGRLDVGLGAGRDRNEFAALGLPFAPLGERLAHLEATVDALESFTAETARPASPPSLQGPRPPLWIAGQSSDVLDLVARRADWANFARGISVEDFAKAADSVRRTTTGRPRDPVRFSLTAAFLSERHLSERATARRLSIESYTRRLRGVNTFVGSPQDIGEQLAPYVAVGCEAIALWPLAGTFADAAESLAAVASACPRLHSTVPVVAS
jgi:alkanesulfonate monooxygenase SsuD/methylene tetrahydromethanopterin reductase-like flavin-dependent oxidoreductase (luciferase family)